MLAREKRCKHIEGMGNIMQGVPKGGHAAAPRHARACVSTTARGMRSASATAMCSRAARGSAGARPETHSSAWPGSMAVMP